MVSAWCYLAMQVSKRLCAPFRISHFFQSQPKQRTLYVAVKVFQRKHFCARVDQACTNHPENPHSVVVGLHFKTMWLHLVPALRTVRRGATNTQNGQNGDRLRAKSKN